jgi:hypothetical protein
MFSVPSSLLILLYISPGLYYVSHVATTFFSHIYFFSLLAISYYFACTRHILCSPSAFYMCLSVFSSIKFSLFPSLLLSFTFYSYNLFPFSCVPASLLSHLLSARSCSKASDALFACASHEALYAQYCTKASSGTERLMVEFIKKMFPCMLPPKIIW